MVRTVADAYIFYSQTAFGINIAGEYSNGFNDCGFWLRGTEAPTTLNPNCAFWNNYGSWNDTVKAGLKNFNLASMDSLIYPFFWTWKVSCVFIYYLVGALGSTFSVLISVDYRRHLGIEAPGASTSVAYFYYTTPLVPRTMPTSFLFFRRHLVSLFIVATVLLVPRGQAKSPGPCPSDSFPCITL